MDRFHSGSIHPAGKVEEGGMTLLEGNLGLLLTSYWETGILILSFLSNVCVCFSFNVWLGGLLEWSHFSWVRSRTFLDRYAWKLLRYVDSLVGSQWESGIHNYSLNRAENKCIWVIPEFWSWLSHWRGNRGVKRLGFGDKPGLSQSRKCKLGSFICMGSFYGLGGGPSNIFPWSYILVKNVYILYIYLDVERNIYKM